MAEGENSIGIGKVAAREGAGYGVIISVMTLAAMLSIDIAAMSMLSMAIFFAVPFLLYASMRRFGQQLGRPAVHSELWMLGIAIFFFASLICALATFVFLRYVQPDYLYRLLSQLITAVEQSPSPQQEATLKALHGIIDNGLIPTPIDVAIQMIWSSTFGGSILSLIVAIFARDKRKATTPPIDNPTNQQ